MTVRCCLLNEAKLAHFPWTKITATAAYLLNGIPKNRIEMNIPSHQLFGKDDNLTHLRTIGARALEHQQQLTGKLTEKVWERRFVTYDHNSPTYRIFDTSTREVIYSETSLAWKLPLEALSHYKANMIRLRL